MSFGCKDFDDQYKLVANLHGRISRWQKSRSQKSMRPIFFCWSYQQEIEECGVCHQGAEDEENAGDHPHGDGRHALDVRRDVGNGVENVDQHKEERDQKCHAARHHFRGN